jgi:hypothetical protein
MATLPHYSDSGPWANAVKAEIAVGRTARIRRDRLLKRRVVRRTRSAVVTPKDLVLFVGQGVKHPTLGYGAIQSVDSGKVRVKFRAGVEMVAASSLGTAAIPVVDTVAVRRAKCFPYPTMKAKKAAEVAERKAARAARNFPYPTAKARKAAIREARLAKCYPYLTLKAKKAAEVAERKAARAARNFPYPTAKAKKAAEREARRIARLSNPIYAGQTNNVMAVSR